MNRAWGQAGLSPVSRAFSCLNTVFFKFLSTYLFIFYILCMSVLPACLHTAFGLSAQRGWKEASASWSWSC